MLEQKIYEFVTKNKLIENGDKIILGVSGGPDSICMLNILNQMSTTGKVDFEIVVAHVNHGLRQNAILDENFVTEFCNKKQIPFFVKQVNIKQIAKEQKRGLEEMGRIVRYEFFEEILQKTKGNKIAIAHNQNDKAETILMNLFRGTGTKGLIGIESLNGKFIRPLLETKRCEIEAYLQQKNIIARQDESNQENIYTRNKIRNKVIPYLQKEFNPNILEGLIRLSGIVKEQEDYLQEQTKAYYEEICIKEIKVTKNYEYNKSNHAQIIINLKKLNDLEILMQKRILFYAIHKIFGTTQKIEKIHMEAMIKLCNRKIGNKFLTPNKNLKIAIQNKQLEIMAI